MAGNTITEKVSSESVLIVAKVPTNTNRGYNECEDCAKD